MKTRGIVGSVIAGLLIFQENSYAGMSSDEAERKAAEIHQKASSDVIYVDSEAIAIYYQNIQIINLLKENNELLKQNLQEIRNSREGKSLNVKAP